MASCIAHSLSRSLFEPSLMDPAALSFPLSLVFLGYRPIFARPHCPQSYRITSRIFIHHLNSTGETLRTPLPSDFWIRDFPRQEQCPIRFRICGWVCLYLLGSEGLNYLIRTRASVPVRLFRPPGPMGRISNTECYPSCQTVETGRPIKRDE